MLRLKMKLKLKFNKISLVKVELIANNNNHLEKLSQHLIRTWHMFHNKNIASGHLLIFEHEPHLSHVGSSHLFHLKKIEQLCNIQSQ